MFFYINFDKAMNRVGLTNIRLSEILKDEYSFIISKESIQKYRKGTRTPEPQFIFYVSQILDVSADYLVGLEEKKIPLIGRASCGMPKEYDLDGYETIAIPSKMYKSGMYAVEAEGDSMKDKINHGDVLFCDPNAQIDIGNIVHYMYDGKSGIKRYKENEKGDTILLVPENNDYDIIIVKKENEKDLLMTRVVRRIEAL